MSHITGTSRVPSLLGQAELVQDNLELLHRVTVFIQWSVGILNGLICLRYLLKLIGASPAVPAAQFVFGATQPVLTMFEDLIQAVQLGGITLEFHALVAMAFYGMLGWVIVQLFRLMFVQAK